MKNEMQLKALIKKIAQEKNIQAQAVMQNYMFERLLERISISDFKDRFILKGGMLIAAMVWAGASFNHGYGCHNPQLSD